MVSTMPCWLARFNALLLCWLAGMGLALAAEIEIHRADLVNEDNGGYSVEADFAFALSPRLEEAVMRGVPLHFVAEFELTRERWYWFDEKLAAASRSWRLSYHALTRQLRLSSGSFNLNFSSLEEALLSLRRLRHWQVLDKGTVSSGSRYDAALRLRLDLSLLPKPFQIEALASKDWNLSSGWQRWSWAAPEVTP